MRKCKTILLAAIAGISLFVSCSDGSTTSVKQDNEQEVQQSKKENKASAVLSQKPEAPTQLKKAEGIAPVWEIPVSDKADLLKDKGQLYLHQDENWYSINLTDGSLTMIPENDNHHLYQLNIFDVKKKKKYKNQGAIFKMIFKRYSVLEAIRIEDTMGRLYKHFIIHQGHPIKLRDYRWHENDLYLISTFKKGNSFLLEKYHFE